MFTEKDLQQIEKHGLTPDAVERQLENFRRGFPFLKVVARRIARRRGDGRGRRGGCRRRGAL